MRTPVDDPMSTLNYSSLGDEEERQCHYQGLWDNLEIERLSGDMRIDLCLHGLDIVLLVALMPH